MQDEVREIKDLTDQFGTFTEYCIDEPDNLKWLTIYIPIDVSGTIRKITYVGGRLSSINEES